MDAGVITATAALVGAVVTLLGALGGGIAYLVNRADKKRETGEALMMTNLKNQIRDAKARIRWQDQIIQLQMRDGNKWREQLIKLEADPVPAEWTAWPPMPEEADA